MALELERVRHCVEHHVNSTPAEQARHLEATRQVMNGLATHLPALCETDRAAVSWYIATLLGALLDSPVREVSELVLDSVVGYSLATAQLVGMMEVPA